MKTGIIGILNNPAQSDNSHSAGWNKYVARVCNNADILTEKDNWDDYDYLIICHGPNYKSGSYNVIGGINEKHYLRLEKLNNFKGIIDSLDDFSVIDFQNKRKLKTNYVINYNVITLPKQSNLIIGDSHSLSIQKDGYEISRNDGKTLHGFLKDPSKFYDRYNYDKVLIYFGNIDIRFHLPRLENPVQETINLAKKYVKYCKENEITPTCLLPIESEERKMPGTGLYKGQKFFGFRELRMELVCIFNSILLENFDDCINWPSEWYDLDPSFYESKVMEPRQSVHIRPKFYNKNLIL